ncbi:HAD family hydrolase [Reichenbachiella ulvae]|uniref:Haloacid dehalogenase-like hydrolase n=1 Tax=Reichenbachiella ulvae TaxID=2980104 RepID=A0ABT3CRF9_9BACT|nr:HAD family hydrolase [Reichenbachiella ulvae]MCV9385858.1 haloacid dehalogenase-like hydrolase [Reichenbachiella ulvae]
MNKITIFSPNIYAGLHSYCSQKPQTLEQAIKDPLPSWNSGENKSAIISFVESVTDTASKDFVPEIERVAVFDNDGTLWSEQPLYFQLFFALDRIRDMAENHPEWQEQQPYQAILTNDMKTLSGFGMKELMEILMTSHAGMSTDEFEKFVTDWISSARHPHFDRPYTDLIFQPMLELLTYLRSNGFKTFIVSGGGIEFMRPWVEDVYGIPRDQVVGSSIKTELVMQGDNPVIIRKPSIDFIDDKEGKPVGIWRFIGRRPILCAGNSDGDLAMQQWTAAGEGPSMMLYVHHTDSEREFAYDRDSHVGKFDEALDVANNKGWKLISMKDDWKVIYPFELK